MLKRCFLVLDVFEKHGLEEKTLPVGDYILEISNSLSFSSTSKWYRLSIDDNEIHYTDGIVHIESDLTGTVFPVSLSGIELELTGQLSSPVNILSTTTSYTELDGVEDYVMRYFNQTTVQTIRDSDMFSFLASNSFSRSFFKGLEKVLPPWISFSIPNGKFLPVTELSTQVSAGLDVLNKWHCKSAPINENSLYSTFIFSTQLIVEIFGDLESIFINKDTDRICIVSDIFHSGGSVYVVFPTRPAFQLPVFQNTIRNAHVQSRSANEINGIQVNRINGFAISLNSGIKVRHEDEALEVWNGDHLLQYRFVCYISILTNISYVICSVLTLVG